MHTVSDGDNIAESVDDEEEKGDYLIWLFKNFNAKE